MSLIYNFPEPDRQAQYSEMTRWRLEMKPDLEPELRRSREPVDYGPGIVCACCGGYKDPQNMVSVWVHQWELQMFLKAIEQAAQSEAHRGN